jgi:hypothetical protein
MLTNLEILGLVLVATFFVVIVFFMSTPKEHFSVKQKSTIKEGYKPPKTNFIIYNYLPHHCISIDVYPSQDKGITYDAPISLVKEIPPLRKGGLTTEQVIDFLKPAYMLRFYIFKPGKENEKQRYADYIIDVESDERIKALHVGQVTGKYLAGNMQQQGLVSTSAIGISAYAAPFVKIHNATEIPLILNGGNIVVEPHQVIRDKGSSLHQGVPLGMIYRDNDRIYPDYHMLSPTTDIYFGVISDLQQSLYSGFSMEYNDSEGEAYDMLCEGWM